MLFAKNETALAHVRAFPTTLETPTQGAARNVRSTMIVQKPRPVLITNAGTHVQVYAVLMRNVLWLTIPHPVPALLDTLVIHFKLATNHHRLVRNNFSSSLTKTKPTVPFKNKMNPRILAIHRPVAHTANVVQFTIMPFAHVWLTILDHPLTADQSVLLVRNVPKIRHALTRNALTLAQALVEQTPVAKL